MVPTVMTFRQRHRAGDPGPSEGQLPDPRSLGLEMDDPHGYLRIERVTIGPRDAVISRTTATGYRGRMTDPDYFTFVRQMSGRYDVRIAGKDYTMGSGSLMAFRPNERLSQVRVGQAGVRRATTIQIPVARTKDIAQAQGLSVDAAFPRDGNPVHGPAGAALARILPQLTQDLFALPAAPVPSRVAQETQNLLDEVLSEMLGQAALPLSSQRIFPAFHRVRQAEEIMHAASDEPVSILQVAQALGVSMRSLQLAFAHVHEGQSPRDVLTRIRLAKARSRLAAADEPGQVTEIAMQSGFFHLGRFAQTYARAYGERPSETLARCRR